MEGKIAEFLAGELEDRTGVEEHLLVCADCRAAFSTAKAGWDAADEWKVSGPSGDAIAATLTSLEPVPSSRAFVRVLQAGTLAASLVIAFAIGTSSRVPVNESRVETAAPVERTTSLASVRPSVGMLFVRDEEGRPAGELAIRRLHVRVDIHDGIARTEIEEVFRNRTDRRLEGTFQFPLPPDASISRLAMEIDGKLMEGEVVERQKARQTYEGIVRSMKDPALLEWMPGGLFQCRIFPIEPRSDKRIVIAYTQALQVFDGGARYVYPLAGESARELGIGRFEFAAMIRSGSKIVKAESTSHQAPTIRLDEKTMRTTFARSDFRPRSDLVVAYETERPDELQVSAHRPEGSEPGYFTAFITPRVEAAEGRRDRRLFFLVDVSGSMTSAEIEATRLVIRRLVGKLGPADRFRIGSHNLIVGAMAESVAPDEAGKRAAERYLADMAIAGASDVATALETVMAEYMADGGELVYVGEGTPTWGEKDPAKIVARVRKAMGDRKVTLRTIAVGSDAEKGLLETLAREFNGGSHSISPSDDVAMRADEIARTLGRPAVSQLKVEFEGAVTDAAPAVLGSLHVGERLLVTGRYGAGPVKLILTGRVHDRAIRREFALPLPEREAGNAHVKRLWAQRRLADLVAQGEAKRDETIKLSVSHQVMTPYSSFLVLENERAYEEHRIERTKKDADQTKDPKIANADREFVEALADYEAKRFDKVMEKCDAILAANPNHPLAREVKDEAQKSRHRQSFAQPELETWRQGRSILSSGPRSTETNANARTSADAGYSLAMRYYDAGDFERAEAECQKALQLDPNHGAAQALMLEVQFALGKGRVTPQSLEFEEIIRMSHARQQHVVIEMRDLLERGTRDFNLGKTADAERSFRTVIEYAKWLPNDKNLEDQRRQAAEMLGRIQSAPSLQLPEEPGQKSAPPEVVLKVLEGEIRRPPAPPPPRAKPVFDGEALAAVIKSTIEPSTWNEAEGRSCVFQNGLMIVRHTPEVQQKVRRFLRDLRASSGASVSVESRFLTVEDDFAERPGSPALDIYNVQDLAYGLQDFPGINPVLQEDAAAVPKQNVPALGDGSRVSGVLSLDDISPAFSPTAGSQFSTFFDPDSGGGPLLGDLPRIDLLYGKARSYRLPLHQETETVRQGTLGKLIQEADVQYGRAMAAADPLYGWGYEASGYLALGAAMAGASFTLNESYDIGGVGFTEVDKLVAGTNTLGRQYEVLSRQLADAGVKVEEYKKRAADAFNKASQADQNRFYFMQQAEALSKDLGSLESQYQELARVRQNLQESIAALNATGIACDAVAPRKALSGQVTAVATELDLVTISIGRDAGVNEGDEFTIYRGGAVVAKITIDRVDRAWSSGGITLKKEEPRVGDHTTNNLLAVPGKGTEAAPPPAPPVRKVRAIAGDEIDIVGIDPAVVKKGTVFVLVRDWTYVAAVQVLDVAKGGAKSRVLRRLRSQTIQEGDLAVPVDSAGDLWKVLPEPIRLDLLSEQRLLEARLKMLLLRKAGGGR